jgi:release factor glutamine methyltransferase
LSASPTIRQALQAAQSDIAETCRLSAREARIEANALMKHALNVKEVYLIAHEKEHLDHDHHLAFKALLKRRLAGEPIAYILGRREFYGLDLAVTPDVLIPRPETELLVDLSLEHIPVNEPKDILDLGTGSGAIALAIASERKSSRILAIDASEQALTVARENAARLGLTNVEFKQGCWFEGLKGHQYDLIVANPPYIPEQDPHLDQGDVRFEPRQALASGEDGMNDLRLIISTAPQYLKPSGWLLVEHGYDQAEACQHQFRLAGFPEIASIPDLAGKDRVTLGRIRP